MRWFRRHVSVLILAGATAGGAVPVLACGFENPDSVTIARGGLNWSFPKAIYVTSAVWQAQLGGIIPRGQTQAGGTAFLGYAGTVRTVNRLRERLSGKKGAGAAPEFSLVLIGPMLWSRFNRTEQSYAVEHHVTGPSPGDVVVVTDAPVIRAIVEDGLSVTTAEELGLIRYYGSDSGTAALREVLKAASVQSDNQITNAAARGDSDAR